MFVCVDLRAQLIVEQFEGGHSVVQLFGLLSLLLLDDLSARFYHRLHLPFHFTQHLVHLLLDTNTQQDLYQVQSKQLSIHPP